MCDFAKPLLFLSEKSIINLGNKIVLPELIIGLVAEKMNTVLKENLKNYYEDVITSVVCSSNWKSKFKETFEDDLVCFCENEEVDDIDDVIKHFGTAEEVSKAFRRR